MDLSCGLATFSPRLSYSNYVLLVAISRYAPAAFHRLEPRRLCKSDSGLISDLPRPTGMSHFSIWSTKRVACHWQLTREWRTVCSTCRPLAANTTASLTSVLKPRKQIAADQLAEFNSAYFVFEAISNIYRASRDFSATAEVIHCTHWWCIDIHLVWRRKCCAWRTASTGVDRCGLWSL